MAMLFYHLVRADSLRELYQGLSCCVGKPSHLGMSAVPKKTTLLLFGLI
ncbi:hypothetical protein DFAR_2620014 [Desulfarculales bacterium]